MAGNEFTVTHGRAREPLIVRGKTLKEALKKERLDPNIWKEVKPPETEEKPPKDD